MSRRRHTHLNARNGCDLPEKWTTIKSRITTVPASLEYSWPLSGEANSKMSLRRRKSYRKLERVSYAYSSRTTQLTFKLCGFFTHYISVYTGVKLCSHLTFKARSHSAFFFWLRLRFLPSQQMGYTGFNRSVHTMRLRQHHQLLCSPLWAKINRSHKIAQCEWALTLPSMP